MDDKPVLICIIGESGSGKTTLSKLITSYFGIQEIESYTDRPMRDNEIGVKTNHTFLSRSQYDEIERTEHRIASVLFGGFRYCATREQVNQHGMCTYIVDELGYKYLLKYFKDEFNIISIRVSCNKNERISRVGIERVSRDIGMFNTNVKFFDYRIIDKNIYETIIEAIRITSEIISKFPTRYKHVRHEES